jgi:putative transposase
MIRRIQQGMIWQGRKEDGSTAPMSKLCRWFQFLRCPAYYRPAKSAPKVRERFDEPIKRLIEADSTFGYRTVAGMLQFNQNSVQPIFQLKGW